MPKKIFMFLLCMLLVISYSQPTEKGLNHLRKLESADIETILIGFDNYNKTLIDNDKNFSLTFNTYFLLKNRHNTKIECNEFDFNDIGIITPFLKQEKYLSKDLANIGFNNIYTIDKSQGSEKADRISATGSNKGDTGII